MSNPRALPFFCLGWQIPGDWNTSCQMPHDGDEKRGQMPCPQLKLQQFSLITKSNSASSSILMNNFLFQFTTALVIQLYFVATPLYESSDFIITVSCAVNIPVLKSLIRSVKGSSSNNREITVVLESSMLNFLKIPYQQIFHSITKKKHVNSRQQFLISLCNSGLICKKEMQ